jgi:8-oxo-dGTP pyrophosphatase MutT (NUDIX family)/phosphohistidine phosphatase SixA
VAEEIRAAGAVVWRQAGPSAQVLLVHRPKYGDWSLPKGKLEPGEHVLAAAVREVAEETGLAVSLGRRLRPVRYLANGLPKRVDYWAAEAPGSAGKFVPNLEIDKVAWVPADDAIGSRTTYQRDAETIAEFLAGPRRTTPLILLRHASAGAKASWKGDDSARPLDAEGEQDARALAGLLPCFGASRVVSAPAERCLATVRPYAATVGGVDVEPAFDATHGRSGAGPDAEKAVATLAAADEPVVICAHRENLPVLVAAACAELGSAPPPGKPLHKGEFLVLHRSGGRLAAFDRHHPERHALLASGR